MQSIAKIFSEAMWPNREDEEKLINYRIKADKIMLWVCGFMTLVCFAVAPVNSMWADVAFIALPTLALAAWLVKRSPGKLDTRLYMGCAFMAYSALMIHVLLGDIEAHFSAFGLIGVLLYYRDWRVIAMATVFIYLHHLIGGLAQSAGAPIYVFDTPEFWYTFWVHVAYFLPFIAMMCLLSVWLKQEGIKQQNIIEKLQQQEEYLLATTKKAEKASHAKTRFLATMSHELRTPLNGILSMAEMLVNGEQSKQKNSLYAKTILESGQSLLVLLNDILSLAKIESGTQTLQLTTLNANQLIKGVELLFGSSAQVKGISICSLWNGPVDARYKGDANRLQQMLTNLVSNAIKFTNKGKISIEATEVEVLNGVALIEFSVSDTGVGIPIHKQAQLFQPFNQLDNTNTRQYGGTGLGLSIVKSLANLMNGEVGVTSQEDQGARFWFRVKLDIDGAAPSATQNNDEKKQEPARQSIQQLTGQVLLVEDNKINQIVVVEILRKIGLSTHIANNGQEALDHINLSEKRPDVILMDIQMPVLDGHSTTKRIREWERTNGLNAIPIIALTAGAFDEDKAQCLAAGMNDYLTKPVRPQELTEVLSKHLNP